MPVTGNKHTYYNLSIRVKADGFSFLVTEGSSGDNLLCKDFQVVEGQALHELLAEQMKSTEITQYGYSRVRIVTYTDATCIPQAEFSADDLPTIYNIVFPRYDQEQYTVSYTHLPQLDMVEVFLVPSDVLRVVSEVYPDVSVTNASAVVLGRIATFCKRQQLPDNALFAYVTPLQLFLFSISDDRLVFANSFPLDQPSDSLYFVLSVWKVLHLNARRNHCFVAGEEGSVEYLTEALKPYLQNIERPSIVIEV